MTFEIQDAKKVLPSYEDVRLVAEMYIHPDVRKWDTDYVHHSEVLVENIHGFTKFFKRLPSDEDQLCLLAKFDGKL